MSSFADNSIEAALEEAKWEAEFAEMREQALIDEYHMDKRNKYDGEQGHDGCFPNLAGPGATVWIRRWGTTGLICYFDTIAEAFEFGHAFLKEHTSDLRSERGTSKDYVTWKDSKGAVWAADYKYGDSLSAIQSKQGGIIGQSEQLLVGIYKSRAIQSSIWAQMSSAVIVPAGLALILGVNKNPKDKLLDSTKDERVSKYIVEWSKPWRSELVLCIE